jgi:DnaJ like chaperone protein
VLHENEVAYLKRVAEIFGFDELAFERMRATYVGDNGNDPYSVLGVDPTASDEEARTAYRRLIREHHPDRLIAQGLPDELVSAATERMAAVNAAWDRIKKARNLP